MAPEAYGYAQALAGFPPSRPKDGPSMCYFFLRLRVLGYSSLRAGGIHHSYQAQ